MLIFSILNFGAVMAGYGIDFEITHIGKLRAS